MTADLLQQTIWLAAVLFAIGFIGLMVRRNMLFMLLSLELMLNAAALLFICGGAVWGQADGQVMFIIVLTVAGAEVAVGLGLLIQLQRRCKSLDIDRLSKMGETE
ncbi:NADH-quinone oxidoreductase subunit NuoK [Marinobacterium jannaschii]|uniref:NADH-quinone oxidoreductase subunit NuoK n=1 Tax=Marinobacterium jannaschii TaxID=64970 RepID=UPI00047F6356|nr:NADH-quinone oxidoreductase subunit NuoK [Marinobacterium jannaschii]